MLFFQFIFSGKAKRNLVESTRAILTDSSFTIPLAGSQTAVQKAVGMYRACDSSSKGLASNFFDEFELIKSFMAGMNLNLTNITVDNSEFVLDRVVQLSLLYGIHTFIAVHVDPHEQINGKSALRVSAKLSTLCILYLCIRY